jgi:hypothetical protein
MAKKRPNIQNIEKMLKRREFVEAFLMEFPTATRSTVAEAWKKKGNRSTIAKDEYDWARQSIKGILHQNPFSLRRHLVQPRRRRMRREQNEAEAKKLKQLHPVGKEVTASTLKKLYDGHFADILGAVIKPSSSGSKSKKYKVVKPLPSPDDYCEKRERHFTKTIAEFVVNLQGPIQEGIENINERLDNMSDSTRDGERGQEAEEALNYLEGVLEALGKDSIPLMVRSLPILWLPEPSKGRSARAYGGQITKQAAGSGGRRDFTAPR